RRGTDRGRQRRQRDGRIRLHGPVPHQHPGHRVRGEGVAVTLEREVTKRDRPQRTRQFAKSEQGGATLRKYASRTGNRAEPDQGPSRFGRTFDSLVDSTRRLGEQTAFYGTALGATIDAVRRYPGEVLRLIAVMGMGTGALAVIGGTVVIVGFLTLTTGALI